MITRIIPLLLAFGLALSPAKAEFGSWPSAGGQWKYNVTVAGGTSGTSLNGGDVSLSTATAAGASSGDTVVYGCACSSTLAAQDCSPTSPPAGNVEATDQTNGNTNMRQSTNYYVVTAANAGTTVTCKGSGGSADATTGVLIAFGGVNIPSPTDATTTTAGGLSTNPNPASITTTTNRAAVVVSCASAVSDTSPGDVTNYATATPGKQSNNANDTGVDVSQAMTWREIAAAGAEDPGAFSTWSSGSWVCATVALRQGG